MTQVCTERRGPHASIASGSPLSPSQHEQHVVDATVADSVSTASQNLAPSPPLHPHPQHVLAALDVDADTQVGGPVTRALVRTLTTSAM